MSLLRRLGQRKTVVLSFVALLIILVAVVAVVADRGSPRDSELVAGNRTEVAPDEGVAPTTVASLVTGDLDGTTTTSTVPPTTVKPVAAGAPAARSRSSSSTTTSPPGATVSSTAEVPTTSAPKVPAGGGRLVYTEPCLGARVRIVYADGSGGTSVAPKSTADDPVYSPDRSRIAFADGGEIAVVGADGTPQFRVPGTDLMSPGWSPDGRWLSFASVGQRPDAIGLAAASPDGAVVMTPSTLDTDANAAIGPDSRLVAFGATAAGQPGVHPFDLYVMDVAGKITRLTSNAETAGGYTLRGWTPDGQVVFSQGADRGTEAISPDGTARHRFADKVGPITWSRDGAIALLTADDGVRRVARDGSTDLLLAGRYGAVSISPDGSRFAAAAQDQVLIARIDGTVERTTASPSATSPTWSPDGTLLAVLVPSAERPCGSGNTLIMEVRVILPDGSFTALGTYQGGRCCSDPLSW